MAASVPSAPIHSLPPLLEDHLGYLLAMTHGGIRAMCDAKLLDELGIEVKQYGVMTALAGLDEPPSQQALGELIRIDRSTMVDLIDLLEGAGYVGRRRNPRDRRQQLIELTPAGERVRRRADRILTGVEDEFLTPLATGERKELKRMLRAIAERYGRAPAAS